MAIILVSTKILSPEQKKLLPIGLPYFEADFIATEAEKKTTRSISNHLIFTSKNGVRFANDNFNLNGKKIYCVGNKTKYLLEQLGLEVSIFAQNSEALANQIVAQNLKANYTFFCGNIRRNELPEILKLNEINLEEIIVYKTILKPIYLEFTWETILFYSPSGIDAFLLKNKPTGKAFCIGSTTALHAKKHFNQVFISDKNPTIHNLIHLVKQYYVK